MMKAVVTVEHGDYDKLQYKDVKIPVPLEDEVLIKVKACGVNNTEINTRLGLVLAIECSNGVCNIINIFHSLCSNYWLKIIC